jgi:UDP-GlcNAc:undecaprenyl-phosphate GlcNAc-1-phosphate transferase
LDQIFGIYAISSLRDLHKGKKPTAGGIVFYISIVLILFILEGYLDLPYPTLYLISFLTLATAIGLIDDIWGIPPLLKFLFIVLVVLVMLIFDIYAKSIIYPIGFVLELGTLGIVLSGVFLFMTINGFNFLDGMDGLAATSSIIILTGTVIVNFLQDQFWLIYLTVPFIAALLAFLKYNRYPSKIFMGDTGSLFLGTYISFILFKTFTSEYSVKLFPMILFLAIPLGEFVLSFLRRLHAGVSPVQADKEHFHHKLLQLGLNYGQTLVMILVLVTFSTLLGIYVFLFHNSLSILFSTMFFFVLVVLIIRLGYFNLYNHTIIIKPSGQDIQSVSMPVPFYFDSFIHKILLVLVDSFSLNLAFYLFVLYKRQYLGEIPTFSPDLELFFLLTMYWILIFILFNLYSLPWDFSIFYKIQRVLKAILFGIILIGILAFDPSRGLTTGQLQSLFIYGIFIGGFVTIGRLMLIYTEGHFKILEYGYKNTLIIVTGKNQPRMMDSFIDRPGTLNKVIGYITLNNTIKIDSDKINCLGQVKNLKEIIHQNSIHEIILTGFPEHAEELNEILSQCVGTHIVLKMFPTGEFIHWKRNISTTSGFPLIRIFNFPLLNWQILLKRVMDIIGGIILMIVLFPVALIGALNLIRKKEKMFRAEKIIGFKGKEFNLYSFNYPESGHPILQKLTGRYPNLIWLLKGDMSLVGIEPKKKDWYLEKEKFIPFIYQRLLMKPGFTSYAEVFNDPGNGNERDVKQVELDLFYINNFSLTLDLRILIRSILRFLN